MNIIYEWDESEIEALLISCKSEDVWPLIQMSFLPGTKLLDAGCGTGRWVRFLTDKGYSVIGLEYSYKTVQMVNKVWPDLDVLQGNCDASPFQAESFDGAISFGVVEHWVDGPRKPLLELYRVLKPGAKLIVTVPCMNKVRRLKRFFYWDEFTQAPRAFLAKIIKGKPKPMSRLDSRYKFAVYPAWGNFFEYRFTINDFHDEVIKAGFQIITHVPTAHMDGIYHELNPLNLLVKHVERKYYPTYLAKIINSILTKLPFAHSHMQAIIAQKPSTNNNQLK